MTNRPLRIAMAHVDLPNQSKGGVSYQVHYLANTLADRGHEVTVFTFSPAYDECRYRVHTFPRPPARRRLLPFAFAARVARADFSGFDVVHVHGDNYLLSGRRVPHLRTFYGSARDEAAAAVSFKRRLYQWLTVYLEEKGARTAQRNVGISEATRERLPGVDTIIPCGVDLSRFTPGPKSEAPSVLFVGTVGGRKRGRLLVESFEREVRPHLPNAELWMVAEKSVESPGVVNHGRVSLETLTELYRSAWLFCLPSAYEGFGVPYIEAMASGTPAVATPNAGAREVMKEGRFGTLVPDAELGTALRALLSDGERRASLARDGLARARDFSWDEVARQYEMVYADMVSGKARAPMAAAVRAAASARERQ